VRPFVAASISPYCGGHRKHAGKIYNGNYQESDQEYKDYHRWLLKAVTKEGPDVLAFEAMPRLDEVKALCSLLQEEFPDQLAYFCFVCLDGKANSSGDCIIECAQFLNSQPQVIAFGANCMPPEHTSSLICKMRSVTKKPLIVYPNSGETWDHAAGVWHQGTKSDQIILQELLPKWREDGATVIGGCCRTDEKYVQ
jgi:homocysteine S-methyltransferase